MTPEGSRSAGAPSPIPLTVLTGFLGAGKTTLLNRLLVDPALADTVVIVNEFGAVGIDHHLVEAADDGIVLLQAGCVCCTVRGDLARTLEDLLRRRDNGRIAPFRRAVVETTGLADPAPIVAAVLHHPYLSRRYALGSVVTVLDAVTGRDALGGRVEARRQVAVADRLVLAKTDHPEADGAALVEAARALNPSAPIARAAEGEATAAFALGGGPFSTDGKLADVAGWLRTEAHAHGGAHAHDASRHGEGIRSVALTSAAPLSPVALDAFLDLVRASYGRRILRAKGLVSTTAEPDRPIVLHLVRHLLHAPAFLAAWPDGDRRSRLVFIVEDVPPGAIERLWEACSGAPAIDRPDAAALADNPLAPPTLARRA